MNRADTSGFSLVELMISMVIAAIVSSILLPALFSFQASSLAEMDRDELHKRAGRLLGYLANDLRDTALFLGAAPHTATSNSIVLVHDSLPGDPLESLGTALRPETGGAADHDALTLLKAVSFAPPIYLTEDAMAGASHVRLDRRPNQPPGSSREILPAPEAISHIVLANHKCCYPVSAADKTLPLEEPLGQAAPAGTELLGVRAHRYYLQADAESNRLYRDNYTSRDILDADIDGLQFEYLLRNGNLVHTPDSTTDIRGVRVSLLVRSRRTKADHLDKATYLLGDRSYGPFNDHYRRVAVSKTVEVRNHGLP